MNTSNLFSQKLICLFFLIAAIAFTNSAEAAIVNWVGANGNWNAGGNWSTGAIPTISDDVIIPAGVVVSVPNAFSAVATTVSVASGSDLRINTTGTLTIANGSNVIGMDIDGRCLVRGTLIVENMTNPLMVANGGTGIYVNGKLICYPSAFVELLNLEGSGINITANGAMYNYGAIFTDDIEIYGILNYNLCRNYGNIELNNNSATGKDMIVNFDVIRNYAGGVITINGGASDGFSNAGLTSILKNWGLITINTPGGNGLHSNKWIYNYAGAEIDVNSAGASGHYIGASGVTKNYGEINCANSGWAGLLNLGEFHNFDLLFIGEAIHYAIRNYTGAILKNDARLHVQGNIFRSLYVDGTVTNTENGYMILSDEIYVQTGTFNNYGILSSSYTGTHVNWAGTFDNFGAIEDQNNSFGSSVNNLQVITEPITGALQNGVPFANALNVVSLTDVNIIGWYTDALATISAGTYDPITNEFTPNVDAIGFSELRVLVEIAASGIQRVNIVTISGGVLPYVVKANDHTYQSDDEQARLSISTNQEVTIYPNPNFGLINLNCSICETTETNVQIYNNLGQLLVNEKYNDGNVLNMPAHLPAGIYQIHLLQKGEIKANKRFELLR